MSRKKKSKSATAPPTKPAPATVAIRQEERSSVAITVAWMLATLACLMAETVWLVGAVWIHAMTDDPSRHPLIIIPDMMRLIAVCTGILAVVLLPFVLHVRRTPPPKAITVFSLFVSLLPLVATLLRFVTSFV